MSRTLKIDEQYKILKIYRSSKDQLDDYQECFLLENKLKFELNSNNRNNLINTILDFNNFLTENLSTNLDRIQIIKKNNDIISSLINLKVLKENSFNDERTFIMEKNSDIIINKLLDKIKINSINDHSSKINECTFGIKIGRVSEFFSTKNAKIFSEPTYLNGLPWRIRTQKYREKNKIGLSFFLECNNNSKKLNWSCNTDVELRLISQNLNSKDLVRSFKHKFNGEAPTFGYKFFISWIDIFENEKGFIKDDLILLEVYIKLINQ